MGPSHPVSVGLVSAKKAQGVWGSFGLACPSPAGPETCIHIAKVSSRSSQLKISPIRPFSTVSDRFRPVRPAPHSRTALLGQPRTQSPRFVSPCRLGFGPGSVGCERNFSCRKCKSDETRPTETGCEWALRIYGEIDRLID